MVGSTSSDSTQTQTSWNAGDPVPNKYIVSLTSVEARDAHLEVLRAKAKELNLDSDPSKFEVTLSRTDQTRPKYFGTIPPELIEWVRGCEDVVSVTQDIHLYASNVTRIL